MLDRLEYTLPDTKSSITSENRPKSFSLNTEHSRHKHIRKQYLGERVKHHIQELCGKKTYGMVNMNT